jgi:hypothetical protein
MRGMGRPRLCRKQTGRAASAAASSGRLIRVVAGAVASVAPSPRVSDRQNGPSIRRRRQYGCAESTGCRSGAWSPRKDAGSAASVVRSALLCEQVGERYAVERGGIYTLPTQWQTWCESSRRVCHAYNDDPAMGTDCWEPRSRRTSSRSSLHHRGEGAVVARGACPRLPAREMRITCEPSRVRSACMVQASEQVVPRQRCPTGAGGRPPRGGGGVTDPTWRKETHKVIPI